jgi:hypothetical protein
VGLLDDDRDDDLLPGDWGPALTQLLRKDRSILDI